MMSVATAVDVAVPERKVAPYTRCYLCGRAASEVDPRDNGAVMANLEGFKPFTGQPAIVCVDCIELEAPDVCFDGKAALALRDEMRKAMKGV